jgi:hypothetical protein
MHGRQGGYYLIGEDTMKNKAKSLIMLIFILLLVISVYAEEKKSFKPKFSLKFTTGWGSAFPIGDVNTCLESFNNNSVFMDYRKYKPAQLVGEIKTLDGKTSHWEAELGFNLTPRIGFGIATAGSFHTRNESSLTYTFVGAFGPQITTWTFKPEVKVSNPVRLSIYYTIFSHPKINFSVGGGFGFYLGKAAQTLEIYLIRPVGIPELTTYQWDAERNFSIGFHGNVVLEYYFTRRLALVAELQQTYVKIRGLKGILKKNSSFGFYFEESGTLYYFTEWDLLIIEGARHACLTVWSHIYEGSVTERHDIRKAVLDLSGYSFRIGIRIRLF